MKRDVDTEMQNRNWLLNTPATDVGFLGALERASKETIKEVLAAIEGKSGHKGRKLALRRRLRQMEIGKAEEMLEHDAGQVSHAAVVETATRQERSTALELATLQQDREFESLQVELQSQKERDIAEAYETAGLLKGLGFVRKVVTVTEIIRLDLVKKSKGYKGIGTWDDYCNYVGLDRHSIDQQLKNLHTFGEDFLVTITGFGLGYREMRKLRQAADQGAITVDGEYVTIGEEMIPIKEDHAPELQEAIERVLQDRTKLLERVGKLEKRLDEAVDEETKSLKAEVKSLVKEVKRLKPYDPEERDRTWAKDQMEEIMKAALGFEALTSKFIMDDRVKEDPVLMGQVEGHLQTAELALQDLRDRWGEALPLFGE